MLIKLRFFVVFVVFMVLAGCGDKKIDLSVDSKSLDIILDDMSPEERVAFLQDIQLISELKQNSFAVQGYTVDQVREEAVHARNFVAEKNRDFIGKLIKELGETQMRSVGLLIGPGGIYTLPKPGYNFKDYTLEKLKKIYVENGGDIGSL